MLPPDDWLVDDDVLEGPEARTASRFRAQPTPDAGGADGTEGPEGGKVRTAQRLRAQPTPCAGSANSREGPEAPSSAEESIAGLLDADAPLEMNEVIFSGPPGAGPTEEEVGAFASDLARKYPGASKDVIVHLGRLWAVFKVGGENGLSYKHSKSQLCEPSLRLLGMIVDSHGVGPDPERIKALTEWPAPRTKGQLREFFGSINWVRPFLGTAFAKAGYHMRQLLKKQVPDDYGDLSPQQQESFEQLKKLAGEYTLLTVPDYEAAKNWEKTGRPFEVFLDASLYGIGAMLAQVDPELHKHRPVAFLSRSLTPTQQAWPAWVRELWGMKEAAMEFASICGGYYTVLWTDHKNNTKISLMPPDACGEKVIRWWGEILRSGYHPRFTAGKVNRRTGSAGTRRTGTRSLSGVRPC